MVNGEGIDEVIQLVSPIGTMKDDGEWDEQTKEMEYVIDDLTSFLQTLLDMYYDISLSMARALRANLNPPEVGAKAKEAC